jgi:hypothetical protein
MRFTYEDTDGSTHFKAWALPLLVIAIVVPIVAGFSAGSQGAGIGAAVAFVVASVLVIAASRSRPFAVMEVAKPGRAGHRVLVVAPGELEPGAAERVVELATGADDVRVLVPATSRRLDRWLSSEDAAVSSARNRLAGSAGTLTAAGLPVSGSIGDSDPLQAVEDELRSFPADEVVFVAGDGDGADVERVRHRLALPLTTVAARRGGER